MQLLTKEHQPKVDYLYLYAVYDGRMAIAKVSEHSSHRALLRLLLNTQTVLSTTKVQDAGILVHDSLDNKVIICPVFGGSIQLDHNNDHHLLFAHPAPHLDPNPIRFAIKTATADLYHRISGQDAMHAQLTAPYEQRGYHI